ncbi:hypothetical protein HZP84_03925 [Elizabethkingia anophelis]|uniref:hypothetical protein n=1 Tax=Elizabethkingia meningoseptica TaxID=238 RepID=UPI0018C2ACFC|nr:hypothetical protein [Elizabethkingia meningoseptica]MBG0515333.1 hypothetical protein [Elizabethkingia meningoseptica]MCT4079277.1 hypothetical protein [Elizabethkingia anophelis]MCT4236748.1 hypothetical protein [Elizabethkingia anophelis]
MTEFNEENLEKIPVSVLGSDNGYLYFNMAFQGLDILAGHLLKSGEWLFGIYFGGRLVGYLYEGVNMGYGDQVQMYLQIFPKNKNDLPEYEKRFEEKVDYHFSSPESFKIIGTLQNSREVIVRDPE